MKNIKLARKEVAPAKCSITVTIDLEQCDDDEYLNRFDVMREVKAIQIDIHNDIVMTIEGFRYGSFKVKKVNYPS